MYVLTIFVVFVTLCEGHITHHTLIRNAVIMKHLRKNNNKNTNTNNAVIEDQYDPTICYYTRQTLGWKKTCPHIENDFYYPESNVTSMSDLYEYHVKQCGDIHVINIIAGSVSMIFIWIWTILVMIAIICKKNSRKMI